MNSKQVKMLTKTTEIQHKVIQKSDLL